MRRLGLFLLGTVLSFSQVLYAQQISESEAKDKAVSFFNNRPSNDSGALRAPKREGYNSNSSETQISLAYTAGENGTNYFYVYNNGENNGYVIVGGDKASKDILGYVPSGHFEYDKAPDNVKWWLGEYEKEISSARKIASQWQNQFAAAPKREVQSSKTTDVRDLFTDIPDLITTKWDQGWPYNAAIPVNGGDSSRPVTGCVATAIAQIMNYWKWPVTGEGNLEFSYSFNNQTSSADFGNTIYDWDNMLDIYIQDGSYTPAQIDAISTLMYHIGVADRMMYYSQGSIGSGSELVNALPQYFKYSDKISLLRRGDYLDDEWEEIIYSEIQAGRPVYLEGGGHAFVLHGYTTDQNMFSVNFGWNGAFDGYYQITATRQYFYDDSNYMDSNPVNILIHIEPNTINHPNPFSNVGDTITVDGIRYDLTGPLSKTVEVTHAPNNEIYSGEVTIPESITYNNETYTVTRIGRWGLADQRPTWGGLNITSLHLPNTLRCIASGGLSRSTLTELHIPDNVELIAEYAFYYMQELTSISLPLNIQYIATYCFNQCSKLDKVELPASIKAFGRSCFTDCSALSLLVLDSPEIPFVYMLNPETTFPMDGNYTPFPKGFSENCVLAVPSDAINDYKNDDVFGLWKTIIPIDSIPANYGQIIDVDNILYKVGFDRLSVAGYNGDGTDVDLVIPSVVTHDNRYYSVAYIEDNAFYQKAFRTAIIEEGIAKLGNRAFEDCASLIKVSLPNTLKEIGESAFSCDYALKSIDIPDGVTDIGNSAFNGCTSITSIKIPKSITHLGSWILSGCNNLQQIQFPSSIKRIPGIAIQSLPALKSLILPVLESLPFEGLGSLPDNAFLGLDSLNTMVCYSPSVPKTDYDNTLYFPESVSTGTLYVPAESIEAYRSADGWQKWGTILPIVPVDSFYLEDISIKETLSDTISIQVFPSNVTEGQIFYSSSNPNIAIIDRYGIITAVGVGEATITAETMDGKTATCTVTVSPQSFVVMYYLDGELFRTDTIQHGNTIVQVPDPVREGYTFNGWSEIPATMPANDITVTGSFTINKYLLTYKVDGETIRSDSIAYGTSLIAKQEPTKEGYTFSGWSEIPATMPANDITVTGSFTINSYVITYMVDGEVFYQDTIEYNGSISLPTAPKKEGYIFVDWLDLPETMPSHDVTITANFTVDDGVIGIELDDSYRVYDLTGKFLGEMTDEDLKLLKPGVYIVNNKKLRVK